MRNPRKLVLAALVALAAPAALLSHYRLTRPGRRRGRTSRWATPTPRAPGPAATSTTAPRASARRSAYASLLAAQKGYALNFRACSGATIPDVTSTQLSALSSSTRYVTISVGGNDAGFADVLTECATPFWAGDCDGAIDGAESFINSSLPGQLSTLYSSIGSRAPSAKVVVVGYPRIFMGEDCNALTWFAPEEQARLNQMADLLNTKLATAASANGFSFANPTSSFIGHAVCDDPEWLNGLSNPISESYHPNTQGHASGYAPTGQPRAHRSAGPDHDVDVRRRARPRVTSRRCCRAGTPPPTAGSSRRSSGPSTCTRGPPGSPRGRRASTSTAGWRATTCGEA